MAQQRRSPPDREREYAAESHRLRSARNTLQKRNLLAGLLPLGTRLHDKSSAPVRPAFDAVAGRQQDETKQAAVSQTARRLRIHSTAPPVLRFTGLLDFETRSTHPLLVSICLEGHGMIGLPHIDPASSAPI
jgi:hypothetical protein